jgi:hypothetical protein
MTRPILALAVAGLLASVAPLSAQTSTTTPAAPSAQQPSTGKPMTTNPSTAQTGCRNDVNRATRTLAALKDESKRQDATREMTMARESMAKNDEAGCMTHVQNAERMMK